MDKGDEPYTKQLAEEAEYWGEAEELLRESGLIPLWFDLRRGERIPIPKHKLRTAAFRLDPATHDIILGPYIRKLLEIVIPEPGRIIDIGCGSGWLSLELARCGMNVTGYDISEPRLETARRFAEESRLSNDPLLHGRFGDLEYKKADLNRLVLEGESCEAVVSSASLHHVADIGHLLGEIKKSLKPGGRFVYIEHIGLPLLEYLYRKLGPGDLPRSPFEDAAGEELLTLTREHFEIVEYRTFSVLLRALAVGFRIYKWPSAPKIGSLKLLRMFDRLLIGSRLTRGEFVFIHAVRR